MSNEFYNESGAPSTSSQGASATIRSEFVAIAAGFAKLPTMAGNQNLPVFVNSGATGMEAVSASSARTKLGLVIGTDVQAYDADLAAIAALTSAADKLPYATGSGAWALTTLTAAARTLLDDADVATMRTTLGAAALAGLSTQDFAAKNLTVAGTLSVAGAFSPASISTGTISASGKITSTVGNNLSVFEASSATTGYSFAKIANSSGGLIFGVENSVGGGAIAGSTAYDGIVSGISGIAFSANNGAAMHMRLSSTGLAVTGTILSSGSTVIGSTGTNAAYTRLINGAGSTYFGVESSTGGSMATGSSAYSTMIAAPAGQSVQIAPNGAVMATFSSSGLAVTGTASATQYTSTSSSAALPAFGVSSGNGLYNNGTNVVGVAVNSANEANFSAAGLALVHGLTTNGGIAVPNLVLSTSQATTSGTSIDFTSIPSWVKKISIMFNGVSTNGTSPIIVQIGNAGVDTTGYLCSIQTGASSVNNTSGFGVEQSRAAVSVVGGRADLNLVGSNAWAFSTVTGRSDSAAMNWGGGNKSLSAALTNLRITTAGGTDTFDAGSVNIIYEG